jgi:hypothetical protein
LKYSNSCLRCLNNAKYGTHEVDCSSVVYYNWEKV